MKPIITRWTLQAGPGVNATAFSLKPGGGFQTGCTTVGFLGSPGRVTSCTLSVFFVYVLRLMCVLPRFGSAPAGLVGFAETRVCSADASACQCLRSRLADSGCRLARALPSDFAVSVSGREISERDAETRRQEIISGVIFFLFFFFSFMFHNGD